MHKVSKVKEQGECGACWAFAGSTVLESKFDANIEISPQHLFSCSQHNCEDGGFAASDTKEVLDKFGYKTEA